MKTINSLSGGQSSAYVAANYPADYNLFALVRVEDPELAFKDSAVAQQVSDRIGKEFIGTSEDDMIIYTMLDLEQYLGKKIEWVSGETFEWVNKNCGGWLPNKLHRYCTAELKIKPMFYWWAENIGEPVNMQIGFRANEGNRVDRMLEKLNDNGLLEFKATFEKHITGRHKGLNKWEDVEWQSPSFPMFDDGVYRDKVVEYWRGKGVRFAWKNNCVHCFHQNPMLLNYRYQIDPKKIEWAARQEGGKNGFWRNDVSYEQIMKYAPQQQMFEDDFSDCEGGCGI